MEALHLAKVAEATFIFMKLDIWKAFGYLEWGFIFVVLAKFRFVPCFINYIWATMVGVASFVLLNGCFTTPFPISRSIRQSCPLSALLFMIVMDVLSNMITTMVVNEYIHGVPFPKLPYQIGHGIYADDIHLIIQDHQEDITFCLELFDHFGVVFGLVCNWRKTYVVYLSKQDLPEQLVTFGWTWEVDVSTTIKLLGIHIADEIVPGLMTKQLKIKLERGLQWLHINPTSLIERVTAINNLILSCLWFAIALWVGTNSILKAYKKEITRFLWSGQGQRKRHCVAELILYLLRQEGGLGVLHSTPMVGSSRKVHYVGHAPWGPSTPNNFEVFY